MPLTVSHLAAILPGCGFAQRQHAVVPLAMGAMVPDLPMYLAQPALAEVAHRGWSILWCDAFGAMLLAALWLRIIWPVICGYLPEVALRFPLETSAGAQASRWVLTLHWYLAAMIGAATHLGLDSLTHANGALVLAWPELTVGFLGAPRYYWLQLALSVLGLVALGVVGVRRWRAVPLPAKVAPGWPRIRRAVMICGLAAFALALVLAIPQSLGIHRFMHWWMLLARTAFISGALMLMMLGAVVGWAWLRPSSQRGGGLSR